MITRFIIEFFVNLIPTFTMPAEIMGAFTEAGTLLIQVNHYLPIGTFFACLAVWLAVWLACAVIRGVLDLL